MKNLFKIVTSPLLDSSALHYRASMVECCRYISKKAPAKEGKTRMMRKDQTDKHTEIIEVDKSDKHRYFKWNYQPLPTQTSEDVVNPHFNIRSPDFKLPNPRGRLARSVWRQRIAEVQAARNDPELEKLSRHRKLFLPLEEIEAEWKHEFGIHDVNKLIRFNQISRDLFHSDDVIMNTWLDVAFTDVKIHRGNLVQPSQLLTSPTSISFTPKEGQLYTLIVSNLDGHPEGTGNEVLHWMVSNISNGDVQNSDTILNYLPPLPWQGTGHHRLTFTLYHQTEGRVQADPINEQNMLKNRCMTSHEFATANHLLPVGITWCQVTWDESVSETCKLLKDLSGEPVFEMEEYLEPKVEQEMLMRKWSELKYRNM